MREITPDEQRAADVAGDRLAAEAIKTLTELGLPEDAARDLIAQAQALGRAMGRIDSSTNSSKDFGCDTVRALKAEGYVVEARKDRPA